MGVIGRLKKDGVIVKTHCSMSPWKKMAWQDEIEIKNGDILKNVPSKKGNFISVDVEVLKDE